MEGAGFGDGERCCRQLLSGMIAPRTWELGLEAVPGAWFMRTHQAWRIMSTCLLSSPRTD